MLSLLLGSLFAFCLALTNIRMKQVWVFLFMLSMMFPPLICIQKFDYKSILLKMLSLALGVGSTNSLYSPEGIALCSAFSMRL